MKKFILFSVIIFTAFSTYMHSQTETAQNPFFMEWITPFQTPPFDQIKDEHFLPALIEGISQRRAEIDAIINNPDAPTFENTIGAMERSGKFLSKVSRVFSNLNSANSNPNLQKVAEQVTPELSKLSNYIYLNETLFNRIKTVYDGKENSDFNKEELRVLENYYLDFVRSGIALNDEDKTKLKEINNELSMLQLKFGDNLRKETNAIGLVIENPDDLIGLPDAVIQGAKELAEQHGMKGKWAFNLQRPSFTPFLQYSERRGLREILYKAYLNRGNNNNENDNKEILSKIASLRVKKANLLGYNTYADFKLERNMAKNSENVLKFLNDLWTPSLAQAKIEAADMQKLINSEGKDYKLEGWDWWYYAEKVKKEKYALDEEMIRPYFKMENVRQGAFDIATKLWGIQFIKLNNVSVYQPDVEVYEVKEADGAHIGLLYTDYYPRDGKRAGAWASSYRSQSNMDREYINPLVINVGNFSKPTEGKPALLSFDEVNTLFHEFGHGLNSLFSKSTYPGVRRSPVDFVELPSQIMENWASHSDILKMYAKHFETGEVIPDELIEKIQKSQYFNKGFETAEYLAASFLDMDWHTLTTSEQQDALTFEDKSLNNIGLIPEVAARYQSTNFNHIFGGDGYSAGYYGYYWAAVLDADAFEAFLETDLFDEKTSELFRTHILERSGSEDPMDLYIKFRGREPNVDALLKRFGFDKSKDAIGLN